MTEPRRLGRRVSRLLRRVSAEQPATPAIRFAWHTQPMDAKLDWEHGDEANRGQLDR